MPNPIEMPSPLPVNSKLFDLNYNQDVSPAGAGFVQTIQRAEPMWIAQYSTPPLTDERDQIFQTFLDTLDGSMNTFIGYDPRRPRPYMYRQALGFGLTSAPWERASGVAPQVIARDYGTRVLMLSGMTTDSQLIRGDYISYLEDNTWFCHRVIVPGIADSMGLMSIGVTPRPRSSVTAANVRLIRAGAAMKIMGRVAKKDTVESFPSYSFNAVQFIDRTVPD